MKRFMCFFLIALFASFASCGDDGSDSSDVATQKFGITGVALGVGTDSSTAKVSNAPLPKGAYVTWETWLENPAWTLPYQPGSYTAWDIQTPAAGGENITEIVGFAKTCVFTDIDNNTGLLGIYSGYYSGTIEDKSYFFITAKGTLHLPGGSTYTSEYRQAIEITKEISDYIDYEVYGQTENTFADRLTFTLNYVVDPSLF